METQVLEMETMSVFIYGSITFIGKLSELRVNWVNTGIIEKDVRLILNVSSGI